MNSGERTAGQVARARCGWLTAATAGLWLLFIGPAWLIAGSAGAIGLSLAAVLCLVPGLTVFWVATLFGSAGSQVPLVILGGTTLRMLFVLLGMIIAQTINPRLGFREFSVWLLVFYLSMLALETLLVLNPSSRPAKV